MHHLADWVLQTDPELLKVDEEMAHGKEATRISIAQLRSDENEIKNGIKLVEEQLAFMVCAILMGVHGLRIICCYCVLGLTTER